MPNQIIISQLLSNILQDPNPCYFLQWLGFYRKPKADTYSPFVTVPAHRQSQLTNW